MARLEFLSTNAEGESEWDISWLRDATPVERGFTAVLRVKNEAQSLPWVLPSLFEAVDHVIIVDNGSDDGTPEIARRLAIEHQVSDALDLFSYPFDVARCGAENLATHPRSLHSLTYFYNWCFSSVATDYAVKWDGDMVLSQRGVQVIRDLSWRLRGTDRVVISFPRSPVYIESEQVAYLDTSLAHAEPWICPNVDDFYYEKGFDWEIAHVPAEAKTRVLSNNVCFELKWLGSDEFAHWTDNDFAPNLGRKRREYEVFTRLERGDQADGVVRVEMAEGDAHVITTIRREYERLLSES